MNAPCFKLDLGLQSQLIEAQGQINLRVSLNVILSGPCCHGHRIYGCLSDNITVCQAEKLHL
jgi:hypothetical protein